MLSSRDWRIQEQVEKYRCRLLGQNSLRLHPTGAGAVEVEVLSHGLKSELFYELSGAATQFDDPRSITYNFF